MHQAYTCCLLHLREIGLPQGLHNKVENMVPLSRYVDTLRKLTNLSPGVLGIHYFIATDDSEAEKIVSSSFEDGASVPSLDARSDLAEQDASHRLRNALCRRF